ncbi:MAG: AAA family ATPase [Candidatus Spyradocola sp.]
MRVLSKQVILSVGREFGSGGHFIGEGLAKRFSLDFYDNNLLEHIAEEKNVSGEPLKKYDERPRNWLLSRTVRGYSNSMQENVANMQFDYLKAMAQEGKSFVIVGRCAESILKGCDGLISIFVLGDWETKRERIMRLYKLSQEDAEHMMSRKDWERKSYHNYYCKRKWGDSRNYDLSINSSRLGIDGTLDILETYIRARLGE